MVGLWDTTKAGKGKGEGSPKRSGRATIPGRAAGPRIGPRSQVEIHNAAQAASSKLCAVAAVRGAALWYAPTGSSRAVPLRCAGWGPAPAPIRLGLFGFVDSTISTPRHAHGFFGRGPPLCPLNPVLDLSMTRSSPPSVLQLTGKQDGGKRGKRKCCCSRDVSWARPLA